MNPGTPEAPHILIVEDDAELRQVVARGLTEAGFKVTSLGEGRDVVETAKLGGIDLVLLDLGLLDIDGLNLTRTLGETSDVGILILSGRGDAVERTIGLEMRADDYLAKPHEPRELIARVRSVLRRLEGNAVGPSETPSQTYSFAGWELDCSRRRVNQPGGEKLDLSSSEYQLLLAFVEHPNRVLSRGLIIDLTQGDHTPAFERSIDVRIGRLRAKIEKDPGNLEIIKTSHGEGYIFAPSVSSTEKIQRSNKTVMGPLVPSASAGSSAATIRPP